MKLNASSRIMREECEKRGYGVETYNDKHLLKISKGEVWFYTRGSRNSKQSSVGFTISEYKHLTRQLLEKIGAPMAEGSYFFDKESGLAWAEERGFPVVFKPSASNHGKGVVVGIKTRDDLARIIPDKVDHRGYILEKVLGGRDFRVLVIGNKFFAATRREPAYVVGDGESSVFELVEVENRNPDRGKGHEANLTRIVIDELVKTYLDEQGLSLEMVPEKDRKVYLRKTAGLSTGGVGIDVTDSVHEENKLLVEEVSRVADLNVVGVDIMAETLEQPIKDQAQAGILELNASPGLRMHHYPFEGQSRNAAGAILDLLFGESK